VTIRWDAVHDLALSGIDWDENNWIGGMKLERSGEMIRATLKRIDGLHGFILAERVGVVSVEPLILTDQSPGEEGKSVTFVQL
jgi:hypothetical protein